VASVESEVQISMFLGNDKGTFGRCPSPGAKMATIFQRFDMP
jgi:hypothetical protein